MRKIRKEDEVIVIAGDDKGHIGVVNRFVGEDRVVVTGVNLVTKHVKAQRPGDREGRLEEEAPVHISNIAIYNRDATKADKITFTKDEDGKRVRVFKSTEEEIPQA